MTVLKLVINKLKVWEIKSYNDSNERETKNSDYLLSHVSGDPLGKLFFAPGQSFCREHGYTMRAMDIRFLQTL